MIRFLQSVNDYKKIECLNEWEVERILGGSIEERINRRDGNQCCLREEQQNHVEC